MMTRWRRATIVGMGTLVLLSSASCSRSTESQPATPSDSNSDPAHNPNAPNRAHDGGKHHRHHRFQNADTWAKHFDDPSRDAWQRPAAVIDFIGIAPDATVADLGAGTGYFAVRFAQQVPRGQVFANDIEPDMIRYLGERAQKEGLDNLHPVQGTTSGPALPNPVDVAFMCNVFHHIEDRLAYFEQVVQDLAPDGRVVIVEFKKDAPADAPGPPPAMRVSQADLIKELAPLGLVPQRVDRELLPHQYIVELVLAPKPKAPTTMQ